MVTDRVGVPRDLAGKWRPRFVADHLEGLADEQRPGAPRTHTDEQVEQAITTTLEQSSPNEDTHWSTLDGSCGRHAADGDSPGPEHSS